MIHGYITAGCHTRGALLGLSLFTILAHLTCVFYLFSVWACFLSYFTSRRNLSPSISSTNRVHDHDNDHQPAETHQRTQQRSSLKLRREGAISHDISSHITHTQNVRPIEESECLAEHHQIEAPFHGCHTRLGCLQASTFYRFHFPPPTIQRLLRSEPGGPFWKQLPHHHPGRRP